jgi:hypothetical protein
MLGKLRAAANTILAKYDNQRELKFRAAKIEIGKEIIDPKIVDTNAILMVSVIPIQAVEQVKSNNG